MGLNLDQAQGLLNKGIEEAQKLIGNPSQVDELLMQLDVGGCDAVIGDSVSFSYTAQQAGYDFKYIDITQYQGGEMSEYAVGCRLGSADLVAKIDETLREMYADGTLTALSEQYLGSDYACDCIVNDLLAEARASGQQG